MKKLLDSFEIILSKNIIITFIFFIFLCFKLIFQVPILNDGGDEAGQWFLVLDFLEGDYSKFSSLHHNLRWANWLPSMLIGVFDQSYVGYYFFNFLRSTTAFFIFYFVVAKIFKPLTSMVFLFLIFFDHDLMIFYFELNPLMTAILYLSLIFLFVYKKKEKIFENRNLFIIIFLFFLLYGVKLPYIFFFIGFAVFTYNLRGTNDLIKSLGIFSLFYIVETLIFNYFNPDFSNLGRIHEIVFSKTIHINNMYVHFPNGMSKLYIFDRWLVNPNSIAYLIGILILCYVLIGKSKELTIFQKDIRIKLFCYLGLAFFYLNTFFIISLDPFMMGQEHHTRYVAHLIFLLFPLIIFFLRYLVVKSHISILPIYTVIFIIIFYPQFSNAFQLISKGQILNFKSITKQFIKYDEYSKIIKNSDCFLSNNKESRLFVTLNFFDRNNFKIFGNGEKWFANRVGVKCDNYFILDSMYNFNEN